MAGYSCFIYPLTSTLFVSIYLTLPYPLLFLQVTRIKSATRIQAAFRTFVKARDLREALRQKKLRIFITRKGGLVIHSMTTASHTTLQFILTYFHFILPAD